MHIGNYNLMLPMEINIPNKAYCHNRLGYNFVYSQAVVISSTGYQGWVGILVRERLELWSIELTRFQGTNMMSCEIVSGVQQNPLIRAYLPLSTLDHLPDLGEALN